MNELKKFKHILVPLVLLCLSWYGVNTFLTGEEVKRNSALTENSARKNAIDLAQRKVALQQAVDSSTGLLYKGDYNDFSNLISVFANDAGITILSTKKSDVRTQGKKHGEKEESIFRDFAAELLIEGSFEAVHSFLGKIDDIKEYVVVTEVSLMENSETTGRNVVRANLVVCAK